MMNHISLQKKAWQGEIDKASMSSALTLQNSGWQELAPAGRSRVGQRVSGQGHVSAMRVCRGAHKDIH